MGALLETCVVFPAPPQVPAWAKDKPAPSPNITWDIQPSILPGGGAYRPLLWLPAESSDVQTTLIYLHGNAEDLGSSEAFLTRLQRSLGVNVLAVEYPGYGLLWDPDGLSDLNVAAVEGINSAALHALYYAVLTQGIHPSSITVYGRSLGSGPALWLANYARLYLNWGISGVVLQSPFLSMTKVAADFAGPLGARLIPAYYDNKLALHELCQAVEGSRHWTPILILHGERDEMVASYHGKELYAEALSLGHTSATAKFPKGATHDDWNFGIDLLPHVSKFIDTHTDEIRTESFRAVSYGNTDDNLKAARYNQPAEAFDAIKPITSLHDYSVDAFANKLNNEYADLSESNIDVLYSIGKEYHLSFEQVAPL